VGHSNAEGTIFTSEARQAPVAGGMLWQERSPVTPFAFLRSANRGEEKGVRGNSTVAIVPSCESESKFRSTEGSDSRHCKYKLQNLCTPLLNSHSSPIAAVLSIHVILNALQVFWVSILSCNRGITRKYSCEQDRLEHLTMSPKYFCQQAELLTLNLFAKKRQFYLQST